MFFGEIIKIKRNFILTSQGFYNRRIYVSRFKEKQETNIEPRPLISKQMAIYTRLSKNDCSQIADEFGLGDLISSTGIRNGSVNTHYLLETKKGRFFVKIDEIKSELEMKQEIDLILFLKRHGFPCLQPLRSKKGKYYHEIQSKQLSVSK